MVTTTTTYSFQTPTVGGDEDAWGGYLNANWDKVDDLLDGTTPISGNPAFTGAPSFSGATNKATIRSDLGLAIGTNVQAYGAHLDDISALGAVSAAAKIMMSSAAGTWAYEDLVGTVSQSGGVATGAVIERGSNANGEYVRYADGTQICWNTYDDTAADWTTASGGVYIRTAALSLTFAAAFSAAPVVVPSVILNAVRASGCSTQVVSTSSTTLRPWTSSSTAAAVAKSVTFSATGRWY